MRESKMCRYCGEEKALDEFRQPKGKGYRDSMCKPCRPKYLQEWRANNRIKELKYRETYREAKNARNREYKLLTTYGLSPTDFQQLLDDQNGCCPVCGIELVIAPPQWSKQPGRAVVDHNHETGLVRGILCVRCNTMLGMAQDSVETLKRAIDYLGEQ